MGRKNIIRRTKQQRGRSPDQEKRGKVLKAFRMVEEDSSLGISGVVRNVPSDDENFPRFSDVPGRHKIFVLDPRIVRREFNSGFQAGYDFGRAKRRIESHTEEDPDQIFGRIGKVVLLGPKNHGRKIVAAYIESSELRKERKALYQTLGDAGLRGFNKKEHRTPPSPVIVLAHLEQPVFTEQERKYVAGAVEDALFIHHAHEFTMGPLQVSDAER